MSILEELGLKRIRVMLLLAVALAARTDAQELRRQVESYVHLHQRQILVELWEALSIPNVAADRENIRKKAYFLREKFTEHGFTAELLETDGNPLVWAEVRTPGADPPSLFPL